MQKIISYPISIVYYLLFQITLIVFQFIQWVCFNFLGNNAYKISKNIMLFFLVLNTYILGTRYKICNLDKLPLGVPLIIVSNHQSLYDTTTIAWFMRKVCPKFIAKIELRKGMFGISYSLNHDGSTFIDRNNPIQALSAIKKMALNIESNKQTVVIFPEGMRCRTGKPKPFAENGLKVLCKYIPSGYIIPVTINNSWKMTKWGNFPFGLGNKIILKIHTPIPVKEKPFSEIFKQTEQTIVKAIFAVDSE